jgi:hypothetical protein
VRCVNLVVSVSAGCAVSGVGAKGLGKLRYIIMKEFKPLLAVQGGSIKFGNDGM